MIFAAATAAPWWVIASIPFLVIGGICLLGIILGQTDCVRTARRREVWAKPEDDEELKAELEELRQWEASRFNPK